MMVSFWREITGCEPFELVRRRNSSEGRFYVWIDSGFITIGTLLWAQKNPRIGAAPQMAPRCQAPLLLGSDRALRQTTRGATGEIQHVSEAIYIDKSSRFPLDFILGIYCGSSGSTTSICLRSTKGLLCQDAASFSWDYHLRASL
jgi:hypothetical protein